MDAVVDSITKTVRMMIGTDHNGHGGGGNEG